MSLKTERERTQALATKVHKCLFNINNALQSMGSTKATDLADVSNKIWKIPTSSGQKFAQGWADVSITDDIHAQLVQIPLNLDFTPTSFWVEFTASSSSPVSMSKFSLCIMNEGQYVSHKGNGPLPAVGKEKTRISKTEAILDVSKPWGVERLTITEWHAIE